MKKRSPTFRFVALALSTLPTVSAALALLVGVTCGGEVQAEPLAFRPGLWAGASNTTLNGQRLPTVLDIQGAMQPAERQAIVDAMAQAGLPAGWAPRLECAPTGSLNLAAIKGAEGCSANVTSQNASGASFDVVCRGRMNGKGHGTVKVIDDRNATGHWTMDGVAMGLPVRMEQSIQAKWIGDSCTDMPPGIDRAWLNRR